jgi:hypothetical protein
MSTENEITNNTLIEIEGDYLRWKEYLNIGAGVLGFNLAISCLGTAAPKTWAFVSVIFMGIFLWYGKNHFPQKIKDLRKAELQGVDEVLLLGLEVKYFGWKALIKNFPLYLMAMLFLTGIAAGALS